MRPHWMPTTCGDRTQSCCNFVALASGGFKRYAREGIILRTNDVPRIDVMLEVGAALEGTTVVKIPVLQKNAFRILRESDAPHC